MTLAVLDSKARCLPNVIVKGKKKMGPVQGKGVTWVRRFDFNTTTCPTSPVLHCKRMSENTPQLLAALYSFVHRCLIHAFCFRLGLCKRAVFVGEFELAGARR